MGLVRTQKIGEGMLIKGKNRSIDINILEISGSEYNRRVKFKINGVVGLSKLELSAEQGYFNLTNEIKIEISNKMDVMGVEGFISVNYHAPRDYKFERKDYRDKYKHKNKSDLNQKEVKNVNHPVGFYYREENKRKNLKIS